MIVTYEGFTSSCAVVYDQIRSSIPDLAQLLVYPQWDIMFVRRQIQLRWRLLNFSSELADDFSLINFIIELAELKVLFKALRRPLINLRKKIKKLAKQGKKVPLRTLADLLASGILEYAFGIGAFVRDVVTAWKLCLRIGKDLEAYVAHQGKLLSSKHKKAWKDLEVLLPQNSLTQVTVRGIPCEVKCEYYWDLQPYTCLTVRYRYWSAEISSFWGKGKAVLAKLGVAWDAQIAWNAIPFSFVIDWFYPVGAWLHQFAEPIVDVNVSIDGCGLGAGAILRRVTYIRGVNGIPSYNDWIQIRSEYVSDFRRWAVPNRDLPGTLEWAKLTMRKIVNGSALAWAVSSSMVKRKR
jgi:hypothetical protein